MSEHEIHYDEYDDKYNFTEACYVYMFILLISADEFLIYMAPHVDNFIGSTEMTKLLINQRGDTPGKLINIHFNAASKAIPYYAVEAMYGGQKVCRYL